MAPDFYLGVLIEELLIEEIYWTDKASEHIRHRTERYPNRPELDIEPEWATEAALDPNRIASLTSGYSLLVLGYSRSAPPRTAGEAGRVLKVWLYPQSLSDGSWIGVTACAANDQDRKAYEKENSTNG
jgi:hypothetical protein